MTSPAPPRVSLRDVVSFVPLPSWIRAAARCGFALDPVLREIGVPVERIGLDGLTITVGQSRQLIESCVARARGMHFPFALGETFGFDAIPEIEVFVATSTTLREALQVYDWVRELMSPAMRVGLHEGGESAQLRIDFGHSARKPLPAVHFAEVFVTSTLKTLRGVLGERAVDRVLFRHAAPAHAAAYAPFLNTQVLFEQPHDAIVLRRALLDTPVHGGFPALHRQAQERIRQRIAKLAARVGVAGQLDRLFFEDPGLLARSVEDCAVLLGLHPRTLQRRLKDQGTGFASVQARSRLRLSCTLLRRSDLRLEEISDRLGFSDRRAFTRAFTRWNGQSPSAYRDAPEDPPLPND